MNENIIVTSSNQMKTLYEIRLDLLFLMLPKILATKFDCTALQLSRLHRILVFAGELLNDDLLLFFSGPDIFYRTLPGWCQIAV